MLYFANGYLYNKFIVIIIIIVTIIIMRKKQSKIDRTAEKLADIIGEHLSTLPKIERKKRINKAHKQIKAFSASSEEYDTQSTLEEPDCMDPTPLAAHKYR